MAKKLSAWELEMAEHREYSSKKDLKAYLPKRDPAYIRYKRKIDEGRDKFLKDLNDIQLSQIINSKLNMGKLRTQAKKFRR